MAGSTGVSENTRVARRFTWFGSQRPLARKVARPLAGFMQIEASGGIVLLAATVIALVWANSPWQQSYIDFWHIETNIDIGTLHFEEDLGHWVNDGLMAIFFFVVGLEIKRELVAGELRDRRKAALPAVAAIGGMVVPALVFFAFNTSGDAASGWGIPMATDIAFAVGVLALLGDRVPSALKVFLLTLAIVDDIGAILVIAIFYTDQLELGWLGTAVGLVALIWVLNRAGVRLVPIYTAIGCVVWFATLQSGVHATIAGVVLGLMAPAKPLLSAKETEEIVDQLNPLTDIEVEDVRSTAFLVRESVSVAERLEDLLHPYSSYVIIPIFALANAGIQLSGEQLREAATAPVTLGIVAGLVVGKIVGIAGTTLLAQRLGIGRLAEGVRTSHVFGVAAIAGIGFTVSLFIIGLAYEDAILIADAKIGVLVASILAAAIGAVILARSGPNTSAPHPALDGDDDLVEDDTPLVATV